MKLYFTGSTSFQGNQAFPYKSLGGYISNSLVPNDNLDYIFKSISEYGKANGKPIYLIMVLYNESLNDYHNVKIWTEYIGSDESDVLDQRFCLIKMAGMDILADDCGDLVTSEKLPTIYSKPFSVSMIEADTQLNAISLPDLPSKQYYGLVLSREILKEITKCDNLSDDQLQSIYIDKTISLATEEKVELHISYDEV